MSAIALPDADQVIQPSPIPEAIGRFFALAGLADPPSSARSLRLDTDHAIDASKTLLAFAADRRDMNLFVALSPALRRNAANEFGRAHRPYIPREPDHPWWDASSVVVGRRYAYSTRDFDFVEVIIDNECCAAFIRAIR